MSEAKEKQQHQQKSHKDKTGKPSAEEIAAKKAAKKAKAQIADEAADEGPSIPAPPPRLIEHYKTKVVPELQQKFGYKNMLAVPRLEKIVFSMGRCRAAASFVFEEPATAERELSVIAGQKPVRCKAK